eukprot:6422260-Amphidinium_carterae.1
MPMAGERLLKERPTATAKALSARKTPCGTKNDHQCDRGLVTGAWMRSSCLAWTPRPANPKFKVFSTAFLCFQLAQVLAVNAVLGAWSASWDGMGSKDQVWMVRFFFDRAAGAEGVSH